MRDVPTLHIRNVPAEVYEALRRRASRSGRSLNAEVIQTLQSSVEQDLNAEALIAELDELRREFLLPDDAPRPEDVVREGREERARHLDELARGI